MKQAAEQIAKHLLDIQAVILRPDDPFTWSSGLRAPIYCDNRLTLAYPNIRKTIAHSFVELIEQRYGNVDVIAGTATAGIPHAAWVSDALNLPMVYVRGSAKSHGKQQQIEGKVQPGQKAVVIEDLISTGGSVLTAVKALQDAGVDVVGVAAIFTYQLQQSEKQFKDAGIEEIGRAHV